MYIYMYMYTCIPGPTSTAATLRASGQVKTTQETTQGRIDGFFSQLPFKCYLPEVASVED